MKNDWINVTEHLPDEGNHVAVTLEGGTVIDKTWFWHAFDDDNMAGLEPVAKWRCIEPIPREGKVNEIRVCRHREDGEYYDVPLVWTFAFMGAEYWCPYCGHTAGMLGAGEDVPSTDELEKRGILNTIHYKLKKDSYLDALSSRICDEMNLPQGGRGNWDDLLQEDKDKFSAIIEQGKSRGKVKIEDVKVELLPIQKGQALSEIEYWALMCGLTKYVEQEKQPA